MISSTEFREQFNELYSGRLKKYQDWKSAPWAKRKNEEIVRSLAHPDLSADLGILFRCTPDSIMGAQLVIEEYLVRVYGLSVEMAESWVLYGATRDIRAILPSNQIDGVRFFNDDLEIAGPSDNEKLSYKNLVADVKRKDKHMNIRIGRSATKQDVKWLIDRYWDDHIVPRLELNFPKPKDQRQKRQLLRNSTIYALHKDGMSVKDIQAYVQKKFGDIVEDSVIRKTCKEFKPQVNLFTPAVEMLKQAPYQQKIDADFEITFNKKPTPHFDFKIV